MLLQRCTACKCKDMCTPMGTPTPAPSGDSATKDLPSRPEGENATPGLACMVVQFGWYLRCRHIAVRLHSSSDCHNHTSIVSDASAVSSVQDQAVFCSIHATMVP